MHNWVVFCSHGLLIHQAMPLVTIIVVYLWCFGYILVQANVTLENTVDSVGLILHRAFSVCSTRTHTDRKMFNMALIVSYLILFRYSSSHCSRTLCCCQRLSNLLQREIISWFAYSVWRRDVSKYVYPLTWHGTAKKKIHQFSTSLVMKICLKN